MHFAQLCCMKVNGAIAMAINYIFLIYIQGIKLKTHNILYINQYVKLRVYPYPSMFKNKVAPEYLVSGSSRTLKVTFSWFLTNMFTWNKKQDPVHLQAWNLLTIFGNVRWCIKNWFLFLTQLFHIEITIIGV